MIILIGGSGQVGKTLMAQRLLEIYQMPYLSVDHLKMGIYRSDPNCGFTPLDVDELIGEKLWPIIREMIKTAIENEQNLIVEGCYLFPHQLQDFEKQYAEKIMPIFITFSPHYIRNQFQTGILQYRNVIENRQEFEAADNDIEEMIQDHESYRRKCSAAGVPYFEIHEDYEQEIEAAYTYINEGMIVNE